MTDRRKETQFNERPVTLAMLGEEHEFSEPTLAHQILKDRESNHHEKYHNLGRRHLKHEVIGALSRLLWAFTGNSRRNRMRDIEYMAQTIAFLADITMEEGMSYIFELIGSEACESSLEDDAKLLLDSQIPSGRLQQFFLRLLREACRSEEERGSLLARFNQLFCCNVELSNVRREELVTNICYINGDLERIIPRVISTRSGRNLFQGRRVAPQVDLAYLSAIAND